MGTLMLLASVPAQASGAQHAQLNASFAPKRLGKGTTLGFSFTITSSSLVPAPLSSVDLYYPAHLGLATSGLGVATCTPEILEIEGPKGCPSQSQMGHGNAIIEVPFGPGVITQTAHTLIFMAHRHQGRVQLLFYAYGDVPVVTAIIFAGSLLPATTPFGGEFEISIPPVPTFPSAPNAAVVQLYATIGPQHLTYYERVRGRYLPYHPEGILLPGTCPRGGFPFAATFGFEDGTQTTARTAIPCPTGQDQHQADQASTVEHSAARDPVRARAPNARLRQALAVAPGGALFVLYDFSFGTNSPHKEQALARRVRYGGSVQRRAHAAP